MDQQAPQNKPNTYTQITQTRLNLPPIEVSPQKAQADYDMRRTTDLQRQEERQEAKAAVQAKIAANREGQQPIDHEKGRGRDAEQTK